MFKDLRGYFDLLGKNGDLNRVADEVELLGIPTILVNMEKEGKAVIIENVKGYNHSVCNNIFGKREFLASVFKCPKEEVAIEFSKRSENMIEPVMLGKGPVQEVVVLGDEVDIEKFPFIVHSAKDGGRYITGGMIIAKDPETGVRNCSFNRMQLKGPRKTGLRMSPTQDLESYYQKAVAKNQPLEIAVVIGNHPLDLLAAACGPARDVDELYIAGGLRQEPVELVKCKTIDVEVPAYAEMVIEGYINPGELEDEGPFGDFQEFYISVMKNHVFHAKAVTMRKDPMVQVIRAGSIDDVTLLGTPREAQLHRVLKSMNIDVCAVNIMVCKNYLTCAISIKKRIENEAKNGLMAVFGSFKFLKNCVFVDHDVDIFDPSDIWWALSTRLRAEQGVMTIPNTVGFGRDKYGIHTTKMGIDATVPLDAWDEFERITIPCIDDL